MPGLWKTSSTPAGFNAGTILLLTDGCVLAQHDGTQQWWKLKPDRHGHYSGGTWRRVARSANARRFFPAAVLPDGRVFVAGGTVKNGQTENLNTVELYDPELDNWTSLQPPAGWQAIGNAPICLLGDGTLLLGSVTDKRCVLFDPANQSWTATGDKLNTSSAGECWTLLPDGSVLSLDCDARAGSQRYFDGEWVDAKQPELSLADAGRIGPAVLLTDGTVFVAGATNATGLFTSPDTWVAGRSLDQAAANVLHHARAAAACLMPNGRILFTLAPSAAAAAPVAPIVFVEYNPANNTIAPVQPQTAPGPLERGHMLMLPDGNVMYTDGTQTVRFYEPDGARNPDWRPFPTHWPTELRPGDTGRLEGAQFTGLSQACASGAQAGPATNYPLTRLRAGQPDGAVTYCRTSIAPPGGVATGTVNQSARFIVPADLAPGAYLLSVIANGIASAEQMVTVVLARAQDGDIDPEQLKMQREMFRRELNEVHLLMDFISGRADKSLADLQHVPDPDRPGEMLKPDDVIRRVCEIRFPPVGTDESKARQAALLLSVKDKLNGLADPARGLSVAYTSMFSGVSNEGRGGTRPEDVYGFANAAYPNLIPKAATFRRWFGLLPWLVLLWAIFTALVSWDVYASSAALATVTTLEDQEAHLGQPGDKFAPSRKDCSLDDNNQLGKAGEKLTGPDVPPVCHRFADIEAKLGTARQELAAFTEEHLAHHPVGWLICMFSLKDNQPGTLQAPREQLAASAISIFTGYIVPIMFGLLGTLASVVRSVWAKVRDATLRPEDARRAVSSVPLGLVAGLSVGLIITPSGNAVQGVSNVAGSITLSATALAFLAGYGAEAFFGMIDELLKRVFSLGGVGSAK